MVNLTHALGFPPFEAKFAPNSVGTTTVLMRLRTLLPDFDVELENFCVAHTGRRNEELHSGALPYDGVNGSQWHGQFYRASQVLLTSMGYKLKDFIGADQAKVAKKEVEAAIDAAAKSVLGDVEAHRKVWDSKTAKKEESGRTGRPVGLAEQDIASNAQRARTPRLLSGSRSPSPTGSWMVTRFPNDRSTCLTCSNA